MNEADEAYSHEAERLRLLDRQTQADLVQMNRNRARNPKLSAKERREAKERAEALARLLGV
jgi:hypothetical protein